ncbi:MULTISPECIES: hypothetical protein [Shewanella]|uniref:hypothetical protein n=1 Tax=Shewanella TaxID=22 RepID=UPI003007BC0A
MMDETLGALSAFLDGSDFCDACARELSRFTGEPVSLSQEKIEILAHNNFNDNQAAAGLHLVKEYFHNLHVNDVPNRQLLRAFVSRGDSSNPEFIFASIVDGAWYRHSGSDLSTMEPLNCELQPIYYHPVSG